MWDDIEASICIPYLSKIIDIINSPIFIVIVSGVILKLISDRRDKKERLRQQQIKFIEEVGRTLHCIFPVLFTEIRRKRFSKESKKEIETLRRELFKTRFTVYVKNAAYFKNNGFSNEFDKIIWELNRIIYLLVDLESDSEFLKKRKLILQEQKASDFDTTNEVNDIYDSLDKRTQDAWFRSRKLLSETLKNDTL